MKEFFSKLKIDIRLKHLAGLNVLSLILLFMVSIHHIALGMSSIDPDIFWLIPWIFAISLELSMFNNAVARGIRFIEMKKNSKKLISDIEANIETELKDSFKIFKSVNFVSNFYYALYAATTAVIPGTKEGEVVKHVLEWENLAIIFETFSKDNLFGFTWAVIVIYLAYKWSAMIPSMIVSQSSTMPIFKEFAEKEEKKIRQNKDRLEKKAKELQESIDNNRRDITSNKEIEMENEKKYDDKEIEEIIKKNDVPESLVDKVINKDEQVFNKYNSEGNKK